jgi:flavodoxin
MTKVLILYYSAYGHMERMAEAVAEGVRETGAEADIKREPELVSEDVAKQSGYKLDQKAPIATVAELPITMRSFLVPGLDSAYSPRRCGIFWIKPDLCG